MIIILTENIINMKYFIKKLDEENNYKIISEVEKIFGSSGEAKSKFVGYLSNVKWNDEDIREKIKDLAVGEEYETNA